MTICVRVVVMFSGIISSIITAHSLGPKGRGELVAVTTLCLTVANFSNLGFPSSNTFYIASNRKLLSSIFYNCVYISLAGAFLGICISFYFLKVDSDQLFWKLSYICIYIFTIMMSNFLANILVSIDLVKKYNYLDLLQNSSILVLYIIGYLFKLPLYWYLIFTLCGTTFGTIWGYINIRKEIIGFFRFDLVLFKKSIRFAIKVFITTFIAFFIAKGNVFILTKTKTVQDVGIFSIALQLYEAIGIIPSAVGMLLFPYLIKSEEGDRFNSMIKILKQLSVVMFFLCLTAYLTIPYLIPFVFGKQFVPSVEIAQLLLPGAFFLGIMSVVSQYLASCGYPKIQVYVWFLAFIVWGLLSFYFVPLFGTKAVAIIISFINCLIFLMLFIVSKKNNQNAKSI